MSRILSIFLLLHWATVFSLLAGFALFGGEGGASSGFSFFGVTLSGTDHLLASFPALKAAVAFGFSICAVLFWWSLVAGVTGSETVAEEVLRLAFSAGTCLMTVMLIVGSLKVPSGVFAAMALHLAALLVSFVAVGSERSLRQRRAARGGEEPSPAGRLTRRYAPQTARLYSFVTSLDGERSVGS